jgi:hypothetical protein
VFTLLLLLGCGGEQIQQPSVTFDPNYTTYADVLAGFVTGETVDYAALSRDRASLDSVVAQFATISGEELEQFSPNEQLAFWINAYNALTLRSVIDHYPVNSIKDIDGVWDKQKWLVAGHQVTIDHIEHGLLRPTYQDARVHFAVNCASIGCPPLLGTPYLGATINEQLDLMSARFVNHPSRNIIDAGTGTITTTELFVWFGEDFVVKYDGSRIYGYLKSEEAAVLNFMRVYANEELATTLDSRSEWRFEHSPYDWNLNSSPGR